jgi:serine/threonine protein kinase
MCLELICEGPTWPWGEPAATIMSKVEKGTAPPLLEHLHKRLTVITSATRADKPFDASDVESIVKECLSKDPEHRPTFTSIVARLDECSNDQLKSRPQLPDSFAAVIDSVRKAANRHTTPADESASALICDNVLRLDFDSGKWVPRSLVINKSARQLSEFKG